jgi:hypothetical protein
MKEYSSEYPYLSLSLHFLIPYFQFLISYLPAGFS